MQIICSATNAVVNGVPVPRGAYEFPVHGDLVVATTGFSNVVTVGMADTLIVYPGGARVEAGPDFLLFFVAGLSFVLAGLGVIAFGRYIARRLGGLGRQTEI